MSFPWLLDPDTAADLARAGATVLDTRHPWLYRFEHVAGAMPVRWQAFAQTGTDKGKLGDRAAIERQLRALGVGGQPVLAVGNPNRWFWFGEDGRIVWMLRSLGCEQAAWVEGGQAAIASRVDIARGASADPPPGAFAVGWRPDWTIACDELQARLSELQVVDTRSRAEYAGATPFGEQRGGHLPRALSCPVQELLDGRGWLRADWRDRLHGNGVDLDRPVVAYCTGGVRSAWLVTVLAAFGCEARNYAGSMWEWAAGDSRDYPLVTTD